jgi:hypothetical protein
LALQFADEAEARLTFGQPGDDIATAVRRLSRQLSPAIVKRFQADRTFRALVLRQSAQVWLDGDVPLTLGLLRWMVDATVGFESLASLVEVHPKSLIRMLGPRGNPSARNLAALFAMLQQIESCRLQVK